MGWVLDLVEEKVMNDIQKHWYKNFLRPTLYAVDP
jgi:hypothetical protein